MNFLIIGDVYSFVGRETIKEWIPKVKTFLEAKGEVLDFIIANGENVTHGKGISSYHYKELKALGIDIITSGNHIFAASTDILSYIDQQDDLLRPLNFNPYHPGKGTILVTKNEKKIRVTNLIGRAFMDKSDNPYYAMEKILKLESENEDLKSDIHIVDLHAEATAEKIAIAWNFDGQITCLVGTHTHVQTADNRILPKGTAFITDIGMSGAYESIIGALPEAVIHRDKAQLPAKFSPAKGQGQFCAVLLTTDDKTNKATKIERIYINPVKQELNLN